MNEVEYYLDNLDHGQQEVAYSLHLLMLSYPGVSAKLRYRIPFYYRKTWITYINTLKSGAIEFCFLRANELSNASGILDFKKRVQVAGIEMNTIKETQSEEVLMVIDEALLLDENVKYTVKKK